MNIIIIIIRFSQSLCPTTVMMFNCFPCHRCQWGQGDCVGHHNAVVTQPGWWCQWIKHALWSGDRTILRPRWRIGRGPIEPAKDLSKYPEVWTPYTTTQTLWCGVGGVEEEGVGRQRTVWMRGKGILGIWFDELIPLGVALLGQFPESDQCQISPPAPPEILHHTVRRAWLFIAYSDERWL